MKLTAPTNKPSRKARKRLPQTITAQEVTALREACTRSTTGTRNRAIIEVMLGAGLRVSEVVALMPSDIDWTAGTIRVNKGKGDRDRVVPVTGDTLAHLQVWSTQRAALGLNGRQHFFVGIRTGYAKLTTRGVQDMVANLGVRAGLDKHITPHQFRHTFATVALDHGLSIREVQELLGHSDVSTTMIYTHVNPEALRRKIQGSSPATAAEQKAAALVAAGFTEEQAQALLLALPTKQ